MVQGLQEQRQEVSRASCKGENLVLRREQQCTTHTMDDTNEILFLLYREAEAAKKAEQARKKAEKDAALAEEEASMPSRKEPKNAKSAAKKTGRGTLDLGQLDEALPSLNATGIDNALDALGVAGNSQDKVDRHPERRFKAAYAAYEERRLEEMESDGSGQGLRLNQKKANIRKEFEKSPENPFNQVTATYNATRDDVAELRAKEKAKVEGRLAR